MRFIYRLLFFASALMLFTSCEVLNNSSKYNFIDGYYKSKIQSKKPVKYYVVAASDSIKVYPAHPGTKKIDTVGTITIFFPPVEKATSFKAVSFRTETFDLDVFTILFKYRRAVRQFPNQLTTGFNGALFTGYRTDVYKLSYKENPLNLSKRDIAHYGFSVGGFAGLGTARMDEYVTLNRINYQYDAAVVTTGLAAEFGINKINFGLTYGFDFLTDRNKQVWINNGKPWLGISIGLNIN
ncbi:MAG: hypothetical protein JWR61_2999 [Ferruginibacter sp.]|jgi:hypothetical protein|uniref:hypothetical protein n=1 Tax=Ferruginibacter sp. TaxID=1940288 RepID=UPI0026596A8A|nr:hypothetical protein [Ferruginibacter sp.]MDB5278044.1 hypothetical protein [Ferruginibacter sp.]